MYGILKGVFRPVCTVSGSPLFGLPEKPIPGVIARPLARFITRVISGHVSAGIGAFSKIPFEQNILTHDREIYNLCQTPPYPVPAPQFGWVHASYLATDYIQDATHIARLKAPTLVLLGGEEKVVNPEAVSSWVSSAQNAGAPAQLKVIPGGRHELFSESPEFRKPAIEESKRWLAEHFFVDRPVT